ncbi:MAG: primosomal replication protein N [Chitinophagaceae bacterium]|nr:primosomal replication protein N [Rubrivivax sp.]
MNRTLLSAALIERKALRYTPAGLPALDLGLKHESTLSEDGHTRQLSFEMRAVGLGQVTQPLSAIGLGQQALFGGFLASARNGRGLLFHITSVEPLS